MSLGALTTTFTPPADCLASTALYWIETSSTFYWLYGKPYQTSCFPLNYAPYQDNYYSPGICPSGYVERCQDLVTGGTTTETRARCCPANGDFQCVSTESSYSYPWGPTLGCMSVYNVDYETAFTTVNATLVGDETAGSSKTIKAPGTMMAYGIAVRYRSSDLTTTATASTQQSASTEATFASSQTPTAASETASSTATAASVGGLSTGAAAGIGVGATICVLLVLGAVAYMFWSRRRKRQQPGQQEYVQQHPYDSYHAYGQAYSGEGHYLHQQHQYSNSQSPTYGGSAMTWSPPPPPPPRELSDNTKTVYEVSAEPTIVIEKHGTSSIRN